MAKKRRLSLEFEGFEQVIQDFERMGGNVKSATEKALKESAKLVTENAKSEIKRHRLTGVTEDSLRENMPVEWQGATAEIKVGFDIKGGGLPSIFLMYGTPKMTPDTKLYNAFYGNSTKKKVHALQEKIFKEEIQKL